MTLNFSMGNHFLSQSIKNIQQGRFSVGFNRNIIRVRNIIRARNIIRHNDRKIIRERKILRSRKISRDIES